MSNLTVTNATVVLPDHILETATVRVDDGVITAIESGSVSSLTEQATIVDAGGAYLIPGVVDLHNDNLEFEIHPRANANLPLHFALSTMEYRLAGAGVTTEFHAVSFQERRDKARSIGDAEHKAEFLAMFDDDDRRAVRHNILHRLDVRTPTSLDSALPSLRRVKTPYASLNDHTPGQGQYRDVDRLIKMAQASQAMRNGVTTEREWYLERMRQGLADTETVPAYYQRLAGELSQTPMILSTHDDDTVDKVEAQLALGATVCEFPITFEAAERARAGGMTILVGAPNVVRGGSQSGNLSAIELAAAGLADAICADYHAPCLIAAAFRLVSEGIREIPEAIAMITRNPAHAVGMTNRGELAIGKVADLVIARLDSAGMPHVEATFVAGRPTFSFSRFPDLEIPEAYATLAPVARTEQVEPASA